jgi:DNA-binding LacI/PurR family transcriptional regulator
MSTQLKRKPTREDVARAAGVSTTAVSYAFSGKGRMPESTRELVLQTAKQLGYEGNYYAQRLRGGNDNMISLFALQLTGGINTDKMTAVLQGLGEHGYYAPLHSLSHSTESRQVEMASTLRRQQPRALAVFAPGIYPAAWDEIKRYHDDGGVVVTFDRKLPFEWDQVLFDRADNLYRAARHLLELGHRDIGFCEHGSAESTERVDGFRRALQEFGVEANPQWLWGEYPDETAGRNLAVKWLKLKKRPTAMCIVNDLAASSFVNNILRAGVRVPEDVSVIGYDNTPAAENCIVPLTSVTHPAQEIAKIVVELLISRIEDTYSGPPRYIGVEADLAIRESTRVL